MNREEAKHLSEVLKAYSEGKELEYRDKNNNRAYNTWRTQTGICKEPPFNPFMYEYRVKPESIYRPYKSAEEFLKAQKEHGPYIKGLCSYVLPDEITNEDIKLALTQTVWKYSDLLTLCWQDGTPCGILEE